MTVFAVPTFALSKLEVIVFETISPATTPASVAVTVASVVPSYTLLFAVISESVNAFLVISWLPELYKRVSVFVLS